MVNLLEMLSRLHRFCRAMLPEGLEADEAEHHPDNAPCQRYYYCKSVFF